MKKKSSAPRQSLGNFLPKLVVAPTFVVAVIFIYGFMFLNAWLSFSSSRLLPTYDWAGTIQYEKLFANDRWWVAAENLMLFGGLFIVICLLLGLFLAIFLDQKIRAEGAIRTIYLYPMALSFIVTGTAWKWILNPELGVQRLVREMGFESFTFDWLVNTEMAIYTVVIAGVWQSSGFVMALCLAGLRGIDDNIIKAAKVDGASMPLIYRKIIIPGLRPVFFSALIVLTHIAIKSFDLIVALTGGGPGFATDVPATFMYTYSFTRGQIGLGSAASMMMLMAVAAIIVPYLYSELREKKDEH
ncbi:carbohydrate ABC transporter membrane protein 1, CUT1 family [Psychromonas ingrahamii 37]|uniref:Carbohydrate ABC transporter membrane protein 1, CUT1 family n=1 Tax=Psychromonas ingrahamii (strain DSM 17664 / CCUG 51855 / 37) TaxID=357804 RepID=A1SW61_PSYIN|nr:sugar ABC transporter permease [Psychromonas ingrahamii]ABM03726.1 carbohydrate ABC transporter membrane protein 1, CUT1 family [Psychromonas ingrahamii 37]